MLFNWKKMGSKRIILGLYIGLLVVFSCQRENNEVVNENIASPETNGYEYDSVYAASIGADNYGMSQYVMAILKTGPNRPTNKAQSDSLFRLHMDNIQRMAENGDLVLAGPFMSNDDWKGIYVFNCKTIEEAEALTKTDPAVKHGSLIMELRPWYGSAALKEVTKLHKRAAKEKV